MLKDKALLPLNLRKNPLVTLQLFRLVNTSVPTKMSQFTARHEEQYTKGPCAAGAAGGGMDSPKAEPPAGEAADEDAMLVQALPPALATLHSLFAGCMHPLQIVHPAHSPRVSPPCLLSGPGLSPLSPV